MKSCRKHYNYFALYLQKERRSFPRILQRLVIRRILFRLQMSRDGFAEEKIAIVSAILIGWEWIFYVGICSTEEEDKNEEVRE